MDIKNYLLDIVKNWIIQLLHAVTTIFILHPSSTSTTVVAMTITKDSNILFKYFNILPYGGRGGVTRFFLLSQGVAFEEEFVSNWPEEKKHLVESGENPSGSVPILYANGQAHPEHIASARYVARVHGLTSGDDYKDYVQDLVADEYQGFRDQWAETTFGGDDDAKQVYKEDVVEGQLKKFDSLYESFKTHDVFLSVSSKTANPLWGDAAVFGLLRDHMLSGFVTREDLSAYPRLMSMFQAYESIPEVKKWLDGLEKKPNPSRKKRKTGYA
jgi:glutathione S-transferase